jgi:hypothetical protein
MTGPPGRGAGHAEAHDDLESQLASIARSVHGQASTSIAEREITQARADAAAAKVSDLEPRRAAEG